MVDYVLELGDFVRKLFHADTRDRIYAFMTRPAYLVALMALTAISFALNAEVVLYTAFALITVFTVFCAPDVLPLMPLLIVGYVANSPNSNPGKNTNSVFSGISGIYVICMAVIIVVSLVYLVIRDREKLFRKNGMLLKGLLILTAAYMISGIGFPGYLRLAWKNIPYGLIQGAALLLPYWLMTGGVDWKRHRKDYFAWLGFAVGCLLVFEVLWIYLSQGVISGGIVDRNKIYTGWGMYNNLGGMLAAMIPFAFWLSVYYKKTWFGYVAGLIMLLGVMASCSRSSMILGALCYLACCLLLPSGRHSFLQWWILLGLAAAVGLILILFREPLFYALNQMLDGTNMHSRLAIYGQGLGEFLKNPILGSSFYPAEGLSYSWAETGITELMPARWHNTAIQLLTSTGIVGFAAYGYHRYQTLQLVRKHGNRLDILLMLSPMVILLGSLVDCHIFNVGPGMFYAMALAWLEKKEM